MATSSVNNQHQQQQQQPSSSSRRRRSWRRIITRSLGLVLFFAVTMVGYSVTFIRAWKLLQESAVMSITSTTTTTTTTATTSLPKTPKQQQQQQQQQRDLPSAKTQSTVRKGTSPTGDAKKSDEAAITTTTTTSTSSSSSSPPPPMSDWPVFTENQTRALIQRLPPFNSNLGNFTSKDKTCIHGHPNHEHMAIIAGSNNTIHTRNHHRSTVEYIACCGLGHRLTRMTAAIFIARKLQAEFHQFWSCCNGIPVFSQLFGDEPLVFDGPAKQKQQQDPIIQPRHLQFHNEVPGFGKVGPGQQKCKSCSEEKIQSDYWLYKDVLMQRYHLKHAVDDFVQTHFAHRTSIGIHVRAGNGETGDFAIKNRHIEDPDVFVRETIALIQQKLESEQKASNTPMDPPILFIATDTPSYIQAFREALNGTANSSTKNSTGTSTITMPVVELSQIRPEQGKGVLFGSYFAVTGSGDKCLAGWDAVLQDMMILSHADIVIAPKVSSFTQTMPISIVGGKPSENRKVQASFCQVERKELKCYKSIQDWCCNSPLRGATYNDVKPDWKEIYE